MTSEERVERKLAAILSADVQGYSRLMGEDEEGTLRALSACREVIDAVIHQHRGRIVGTAGDSVLAEFASVVDAVRCAVEIQRQLKAKNADLPAHRRMEFRIGINLGDVMVDGEQIYGDGVNIAARLESLAEAGGICIAGTVYDQIENKLALNYEYLGEQTVKNIAKPVRVYRVRIGETDLSVETPRRGVSTLPPHEQTQALPLPNKPSIAVLPFVNMSSDPEQEYFSDGITEDLITDLSRLSGLFVIARNSSFTYKGKAVKIEEVGRELGVRYVLEGSVRKAGNRVRITAQLVDATTSHHLWAERYDRELQDIFALQDEIVQRIVTTLELQLTLWEQGVLVRKSTPNLEAYDYYLRGQAYWWHITKEANVQARQMYEKALELDPTYATAYVGLGGTYFMEWAWQWSQGPHSFGQVVALAQQAVTLDDSLPWAHIFLGVVYLWQKQHDQAVAEIERAIALDPNSADGYVWLAHVLKLAGRPAEAIELVEKAMRLNPRYPVTYWFELGMASLWAGRYEEAVIAFKRILTRNPDFLPAHIHLAASYSELGQEEVARTEAAEVLRLNPTYSLEVYRQRVPLRNPAVLERTLAALRKAGLK
ncbi:MAG: adenylate/guanylate cyclase domain-containing protein [Deltaproteobacteria bacterium]|nr:adenylate/guanylate cyclase domain-containing protein [Deltaproteobacteria bacterium]